ARRIELDDDERRAFFLCALDSADDVIGRRGPDRVLHREQERALRAGRLLVRRILGGRDPCDEERESREQRRRSAAKSARPWKHAPDDSTRRRTRRFLPRLAV